eukprot:maker-scaffold_3-snap-gene-1.48-mRNA-1 protein AED:0.09 eAED:0.09 QI:346/0.75/0.8/1/1/1/5/462/278
MQTETKTLLVSFVVLLLSYTYISSMVSVNEPLRAKLKEPVPPRTALVDKLVIGGTGATGRHVVKNLLERDAWKKVICVGRSAFDPTKYKFDLTDAQSNKLENVVVEDVKDDMESVKEKFDGVDSVFNCIGTTRKIAGSAKKFVEIEFGISDKLAQVAEEAKVPHISILAAQGANSKVPAVNFVHPLLYTNTMGRKQDTALTRNFQEISIFQPGMLKRGETKRLMEKLTAVLPSLEVEKLAKVMVLDAENIPQKKEDDKKNNPIFYSGSNIITQQLAFF